ncbi:hypothetical protein BX666DRAFT_1853288, partial [Dichotomocladium elegans]
DELVDDEDLQPSATAEAMDTYTNLLTNIYLGHATGKSITGEESMPCDCRYNPKIDDPSAACGDDNLCINRMMFMECTEKDCACDRFCRNRRFQLRQYARVDVFKTEKKGFGLRALTDLPSNAFVMEYIGEVITHAEFVRRTQVYEEEGLKHYYFMTLKTDEIIDATKKGCLARFINHSCNPSCVTQKWVVGKSMRIGIFTRRPIKAGEELTFDYKFERYGAVAQKCYCGEKACKGYIGGVLEEDDASIPQMAASDNEEGINEPEMPRKLTKRRGRAPRALRHTDDVQAFVKKMIDSVGTVELVGKLLRTLEVTAAELPNSKDVLKLFVRFHGLKMLKIWLGEWKHDQEIIEKVLRVLQELPLVNRNGLEDCNMFEVVQKLVMHDNKDIRDLAQCLLEKWCQLKSVYRIPKRAVSINTDSEDGRRCLDGSNDAKPKKKARFGSTRDFFDPDDSYYEYIPLDVNADDIHSMIQYPPMSHIPTGPRAQSYPSYHPYSLVHPEKRTYTPRPGTSDSEAYTRAYYTGSSTRFRPNHHSYYERSRYHEPSVRPSPQTGSADSIKLPPNWKFAYADTGKIYYYNKVSGKTQWEVPEDKASSIEGVTQSQIEGLVEKAILNSSQKKKISNDSDLSATSSISPSKREVDAKPPGGGDGLGEAELKQEIGKIVTKYLSQKKEIWNNDKSVFKELARKMTHHIVNRELKSSRRIKSINDSTRAKIEKFIDNHGAEFLQKTDKKKNGKEEEEETRLPYSSPTMAVRGRYSTDNESTPYHQERRYDDYYANRHLRYSSTSRANSPYDAERRYPSYHMSRHPRYDSGRDHHIRPPRRRFEDDYGYY